MPRNDGLLWIVAAQLVLGVALVPVGWEISQLADVIFLGNTLTALVACFCGGSIAVLAHALIAGGLALHHVGWTDWRCLLGFVGAWLAPMMLKPNWPAPRQWLFRQVLSFRERLSGSPSAGGSAACSAL